MGILVDSKCQNTVILPVNTVDTGGLSVRQNGRLINLGKGGGVCWGFPAQMTAQNSVNEPLDVC